MLLQNAVLIGILILINGFFAAVEMALVASRRPRLQSMVEDGSTSAEDVLKAKEHPGNYLATVQVGISLVGTLASAVGGASAVPVLAELIATVAPLAPFADQLALVFIVLLITYLSLVFGELVPKQFALRNPETLATSFIRPTHRTIPRCSRSCSARTRSGRRWHDR